MNRIVAEAAILMLVTSALGAVVNALRPNGLPWVYEEPDAAMPLEELKRHVREGTVTLVDARKHEEYVNGHLELAVSVPAAQRASLVNKVMEMVPRGELVVIYCGGGGCEASQEVFEFLLGLGYAKERLRIYEPGWEVLEDQKDLSIVEGDE